MKKSVSTITVMFVDPFAHRIRFFTDNQRD